MNKRVINQLRAIAKRLEADAERLNRMADAEEAYAPTGKVGSVKPNTGKHETSGRRKVKTAPKKSPQGSSDFYLKRGVWYSRKTGKPLIQRKQRELSSGD